jgi:virulence-associated protein VagC
MFERPSSVREIGKLAFYRSAVISIEIPENCDVVDEACIGVKSVSVSSRNPFFLAEGDLLMSIDKTKLVHCFRFSQRIVIPQSVELIGKYCFAYSHCVSEIMFENDCNLKQIDIAAFRYSNLTSVRIPRTVEFIGKSCFHGCKSLSEIIFEGGCNFKHLYKKTFDVSGLKSVRIPANVEFIGESCFAFCASLSEVIFEHGSNLKRIDKDAFRGSRLTSVRIPPKVEFIGEHCFSSCKSLSEVIFGRRHC